MPSDEKTAKESKKLETLKVRRSVVSKHLDRLKQFVDSFTEDVTLAQLELRLSALDTSFNALEELQGKIEQLDPGQVKDEEDIRARCEELYYEIHPRIRVK